MLCSTCEAFARSVLDQDFSTWKQYSADEGIRIEFIHKDRAAIFQTAASGCVFCKFFNASPSRNQHDPCFIKIVPWGELDNGVFHFVFSTGSAYHTVSEFQMFVVPNQSEQISAIEKLHDKLPYCPSSWPNSPRCLSLVHLWRKQCQQSHPSCTRAETPLLPTRVIDVCPTTSSGRPRLFVTNGFRAEYITLSYCWGQAGQRITIKDNIDEHQEGIELGRLPKTIQDAIEITRALGFQYIWIDTVCIIQDDAEDWQREAAAMASVYRNGAICLSILDSPNSDTGFLEERKVHQVVTRFDGVDLAIRADPFLAMGPKEGLSPLETRAWCLQERVLAPALLHFETNHLMWECNTAFASEAYPHFRNDITGRPHGLTLNQSITHAKSYVSGSLLGPRTYILNLWYSLVVDYTHRLLTKRSDRLLAIQGLASRIRISMGRESEYCSGLWLEDIHKGLLWNVNMETSIPAESTQVNPQEIPTWSWASVIRGVNFAGVPVPSSTGIVFEAKIRKGNARVGDRESTETPILGPNMLHIDTYCLEGVCCLRESRYRNPKDYPFKFATQNPDLPHLPCNLDRVDGSVPSADRYRCLLISAVVHSAYYDGQRYAALYDLILEQAGDSLHDHRGLRTFKRAGKGMMTHDRVCIEDIGCSPLGPFESAKKEEFILV